MFWAILAVKTIHVLVCLILILVVLLQSGKAADLAGAFGGMGSQTVFGPRGTATVLSKATTIAAGLFMVTSLTLGILANGQTHESKSVTDSITTKAPAKPAAKPVVPAPATPAPVAPAPAAPAAPGNK